MKRLALAVAVLGLVACKKGEEAQPAAQTPAPAAAPAPAMMDSSKMMADTSKRMGAMHDTTKAMGQQQKGAMKKND